MKIRNLMLPVMAFICAIGMAFATSHYSNPNNDFIDTGTTVLMIEEIECGSGDEDCTVQREEDGPEYQVYDDQNLLIPKDSDNEDPFLLY